MNKKTSQECGDKKRQMRGQRHTQVEAWGGTLTNTQQSAEKCPLSQRAGAEADTRDLWVMA